MYDGYWYCYRYSCIQCFSSWIFLFLLQFNSLRRQGKLSVCVYFLRTHSMMTSRNFPISYLPSLPLSFSLLPSLLCFFFFPTPLPFYLVWERCPSADEWIRKLYIYTMEYYSAIKRNSFESVLMRWMKLEPIIQSKVSQKDKDQYSILMHIYEI